MSPGSVLPMIGLLLAACSAPVPREPLAGHLHAKPETTASVGNIPAPIQVPLSPTAKPNAVTRPEIFSVSVNNVPVRELLLALARDSRLNIDVYPDIAGVVTLNAIDQTLPQLLARISRQVDIRYELDGKNLAIMPDTPFLRHYKVDYVNMARNVTGTISTNTQIASAPSPNASNLPAGGNSGNISNTRIENVSRNQFWESLERNIKDILRETDKILPDGSSETVVEQTTSQNASGIAPPIRTQNHRGSNRSSPVAPSQPVPYANNSQSAGNSVVRRSTFHEAASVIVHAETGIVTVRATRRQHERIQEFIDRVGGSARKQVLIEATIVEVVLKDAYQQGINWTQLTGGGVLQFIGNAFTKNAANLQYVRNGNPDALITLLDTFGTVKVLSSPRLSVVNNQTALLKVVENYVYFTVKADTTTTANVGTTTAYTTTPQSVSVGLVVSVTPQIGDNDVVLLNVRPTITSIAREVPDPNPDLVKNQISNLVPVIRTREIESVMRVASGHTAILGGLMEDRIDHQTQRIPGLGQIPLVGEVANNRNNSAQKTELVIFLRPVVVNDASLEGDYAPWRHNLPEDDFFEQPLATLPATPDARMH
jgi:general secretion pathway protein D